MIGLINRRRAAQSGSPVLPYDAEVEYLRVQENTCAYINTGIIPTSDMGLKIVFETTKAIVAPMCGTFANSGGNLCVRMALYNFFIVYNGSTYIDTGVDKSTALNTKTTIIIDTNHNITVNGETVGQFTRNSQMNEIPIYLFTSNTGSSVNGTPAIKVYEFSLFTSNATVLDLNPVRVGQTGYMYDRISGQLFGNSGTGDFILGNDK